VIGAVSPGAENDNRQQSYKGGFVTLVLAMLEAPSLRLNDEWAYYGA